MAKGRKKEIECKIVHPDRRVYSISLPSRCTGQQILDKMCGTLGIVEKDYFGLQFTDASSGCGIWVNNRLQLRNQIKAKPPYELLFKVKYYTDPPLIQQQATLEAFFKDLKWQIKSGQIDVPDSKKSEMGAYIAQVDFGDRIVTPVQSLCVNYPAYFPNWNGGLAHIIAKEHNKLRGVSKFDAMLVFVSEMYTLDTSGMQLVSGEVNHRTATLGIGGAPRCIQVFDSQSRCIEKVPYYTLTQVSFGNNFFGIKYNARDEDNNPFVKSLRLQLNSHTLAMNLFRSVTEEQVFFFQSTVLPLVAEHAERRHMKWKAFCKKYLRKTFETKYYYDIARTKNEVYRHAFQQLHQLDQTEMDSAAVNFSSRPTVNSEDTEYQSSSESEHKTKISWGLSTSSCNLAKQLLSDSQLCLTESEENLPFLAVQNLQPSPEEQHEHPNSPQPLNRSQGRKLRQLLMKIQDERLCHVCMDELISSVFCPCGHYVACYRCAKRLDKCPVCRQQVGFVQYVYNTSHNGIV